MTDKRPWSQRELRYVQTHFGSEFAGDIAIRLKRTRSAVYQVARKLGLSEVRDAQRVERLKRKIEKLNSQGFRDSEIGDRLGIDRRRVCDLRRSLGLPAIGRNESYRRMVARTTKRQCELAGVKSLAELRSKEMKRIARNLGWPDSLSVRAVQILETLYRRGPMTRKQIALAIGMPWVGSRRTFKNNRVPGQSYTAELIRAGLVIRLESAICRPGKGNHEDVYMVGLGVEPCRSKKV
jgi:hypothetical protein